MFAGLFAQGVGIWMGVQAFINMGVNLGVLPTKGLTLPLMSYGGSAILMNLVALAIVLRSISRTGSSCAEAAHECCRRRLMIAQDVRPRQRRGEPESALMRGGRA